MQNFLLKFGKLVLVIVLFINCSDEAQPVDVPTKSPIKKVSQPKVSKVKVPANNLYTWLQEYDKNSSLAIQIPPPENFSRTKELDGTFQQWLQYLPLFPDGQKVKLHNGKLKLNQSAHHRVVNIDIGKRDLQQCADAVMRMRSEFLFSKKDFEKIHFNYSNGTKVSFQDWKNGKKPIVNGNSVTFREDGKKDGSYASFKKYLIQIFAYAGTASLEKEMKSIPLSDMRIGDVLIQGGHPGHAVLVVDMAVNEEGKKMYLLAQSYMPAQNFHILKNPMNSELSPWYELTPNKRITTPEWKFSPQDLKRFVE